MLNRDSYPFDTNANSYWYQLNKSDLQMYKHQFGFALSLVFYSFYSLQLLFNAFDELENLYSFTNFELSFTRFSFEFYSALFRFSWT